MRTPTLLDGDGHAYIDHPAGSTNQNMWFGALASVELATEYIFWFDKVPTGARNDISFNGRWIDKTTHYQCTLAVNPTGNMTLHFTKEVFGKDTSFPPIDTGLTPVPFEVYKAKAQWTGLNPTTMRCNVWAASHAEPSEWTVSEIDSEPSLQGRGSAGPRNLTPGPVTNPPHRTYYDAIYVSREYPAPAAPG